jgi:hypothetical protein
MALRNARKTDPTTSHEAAASTTEDRENHLNRVILYVLDRYPLTDEQLADKITKLPWRVKTTAQGIRTARVRLERAGELEIWGITKTKYNRNARVWVRKNWQGGDLD